MASSPTSDALSPARVRAALAPFGFDASPLICEQVRAYTELLLKWNQKLNLTSIVKPREILERHFGESLFALFAIPGGARTLTDIGSGAGFPGLVLKMARPDLEVTLHEPVLKKVAFLKEAARALGLTVRVRSLRIEDDATGEMQCDCFTVRAVRLTEPILQRVHRMLPLGGTLIAWTGIGDAEDTRHLKIFAWREFAYPTGPHRILLVGEKLA